MNILIFFLEWQFPAMNILIFVLNGSSWRRTYSFFLMAVPGREQITFPFAFISLLFLFSIHNKNVLFYFENQNKMNQKILGFFRFIFNTK